MTTAAHAVGGGDRDGGRSVAQEVRGVARILFAIVRARFGGPATGGTMCVVVRQDGFVLSVKPRYRRHWSLPGGFLDHGEDPMVGAVREVSEETGARLIGDPILIITRARANHVDYLFAGRVDPAAMRAATTPWEISATRWIDPAQCGHLGTMTKEMFETVPGGLPGIVARVTASPDRHPTGDGIA